MLKVLGISIVGLLELYLLGEVVALVRQTPEFFAHVVSF